jgi:pilus assembly protein CpaC
LQNVSKANQQQVPWLGDVPVLGALFASRSYLKDETDLAIIVTPRIVRPARPGDPVKTPLDNTVPGNDVDFFLHGKGEIPRGELRTAMGAERPNTGHVLDLPRGDSDVVVSKN